MRYPREFFAESFVMMDISDKTLPTTGPYAPKKYSSKLIRLVMESEHPENCAMKNPIGNLNEYAFSSNELFGRNPTFPVNYIVDGIQLVYRNIRHLYMMNIPLYYDSTHLGSACFKQSATNVDCHGMVRLDSAEPDGCTNALATFKLVVANEYFHKRGVNINRTGSLIVPLPIKIPKVNIEFPEKRATAYWFLLIRYNKRSYVFRVSFHLSDQDVDGQSELDIKCRDPIDINTFVEIFRALRIYYNYQYDHRNKHIVPIVNWNWISSRMDLTQLPLNLRNYLKSMKVVPKECWDSFSSRLVVSSTAYEFVMFIGLLEFLKVDESCPWIEYILMNNVDIKPIEQSIDDN